MGMGASFRLLLTASLVCLAPAQTVDKSLTFDVASVKPAEFPKPDGRGRIMIGGPSGGPGTKDPGRIRYPFTNLRNLITIAYDVKTFQVVGPSTLDTERFEVNATMPPNTTKEQFQVMLQNLLAERFKLTVHRDTKDLPVYSMIVAKGGPKMKESGPPPEPKDEPDGPPALPPGGPKIGPDGFPDMSGIIGGRGGIFNVMMPGRARMVAVQQTMQDLATRLGQQLNKPVIDNTGLTSKYDFMLTFSMEGLEMPGLRGGPMPPPPPGATPVAGPMAMPNIPEGEAPPDIFAAIQAQLGLKLESKKGPVEQIVVDHVEKTPTEN